MNFFKKMYFNSRWLLVKNSKQRHCSHVVFPTYRHQSDLGKEFGWKLGQLHLSLDSASEQSLILLSAVSPRLSFANELFIHLHHNVISQIWNGLKVLKICRWKIVKVELQYIAESSPHTLLAHICCTGLCKNSVSHHVPAVSCRQHRQSLWIDSKGGIFSWLHEMED